MIQNLINQFVSIFTGGFVSAIEDSQAWLFDHIDAELLDTYQAPLSSQWFYHFFQKMELMALALILPLFLVAVVSALVAGSGSYLARLITLYLPISLLGSGVLLFVFQTLSAAIDGMSNWVISSSNVSLSALAHTLPSSTSIGGSINPAPFFLIAIAGVFSVLASLSLYFEILLRQGAILILAAFIPIVLLFVLLSSSRAVMVRYIEVTVGVLFSKLFVATLLSLGTELAMHSVHAGEFSQFLIGTSIVIMSAFSPFLLFSLIPITHLDHQARLSQKGRMAARAMTQRGAAALIGSPTTVTGEIPMANATTVPSYLKKID